MCCEHVWTSSNFNKICYMYWLHPSCFEAQQFGNLPCLHHQDRCIHTSTLLVDRGEGDICMHVHVQRHKHIHILCALVQPSRLLPYWFAVIKRDGVIHCFNPNMEALPSIETSFIIHSQQEISTTTTMETSNLTKSFQMGAFQSTERTIYNLQSISIRLG